MSLKGSRPLQVRMPARQQKSRFPPALPPSDCGGPQLHLFPDHDSLITWYERLGADENDPGNEGYVFRAVICQREYAIKVVRLPLLGFVVRSIYITTRSVQFF
jgi:hypothetical protein